MFARYFYALAYLLYYSGSVSSFMFISYAAPGLNFRASGVLLVNCCIRPLASLVLVAHCSPGGSMFHYVSLLAPLCRLL